MSAMERPGTLARAIRYRNQSGELIVLGMASKRAQQESKGREIAHGWISFSDLTYKVTIRPRSH